MQQLGISPAVIPPFFTNPDILLNRGRGGNIVETPRLRKLTASSRGDKDSHDEPSSMAFSNFLQFLNDQPSDFQDITSTAFASVWCGWGMVQEVARSCCWTISCEGGSQPTCNFNNPFNNPSMTLLTPSSTKHSIPHDSRTYTTCAPTLHKNGCNCNTGFTYAARLLHCDHINYYIQCTSSTYCDFLILLNIRPC